MKRTAAGYELHGMTNTPTYHVWRQIKQRCLNPKNARYADYGGRGITVCKRWSDSFSAFVSDMGEAPRGMSIDRVDNDRGYEPGNCRWATYSEQNSNYRRNVMVTFGGETMCMQAWARRLGIGWNALRNRLKRWPKDRALTEPSRPGVGIANRGKP